MLSLANRERLLLIGGLAVLSVLCWLYLIEMAADMAAMPASGMAMDMPMDMDMSWGAKELASLFLMWAVMMVAMMLPSALPMITTFMAVNQRRKQACRPTIPSYVFTAGYIAVWTLYSAAATVLQWLLHEQALISPQMATHSPYLAAGILVAAGIYQFTPWKQACLHYCRSPLSLLMNGWREGYSGALAMGLRHGSFCVACCWSLMLILFVTGVMNLLAVTALALFVLAEKLLPRGYLLARISGALLIAAGLGMLATTA